jgi:minor extracellular serine protease Vpr
MAIRLLRTATILLPAFLFTSAAAFAQGRASAPTRMLLHDVLAARNSADRQAMARTATLHDLQMKDGVWYASAAALVDETILDEQRLEDLGVRINSRLNGLVTLRFPIERMADLLNVPGVRYLDSSAGIAPELQYALGDTRADSVHAGLGGLPMAYTGEGVVIAIIDWGFDYTHPVFRDTSFTTLRLTKAWDQNKTSGPAPQGYDFGTEYAGQAALLAAQQDTLYVFGPSSHGTHVGGIAGGNGAGSVNKGIAPEAELLFVSLLRTPAGFIDAITWIKDHAESVGKPFVVNMSFGSHQGPHDGTLLQNVAMDQMAGPGRVFVGSAGNNGTGNFHLAHSFSSIADTLRTVVDFGTSAEHWGQSVSIWGEPGASFDLGLRFTDNSNTLRYETQYFRTADDPLLVDTIVLAPGDTIVLRVAGEAASMLNNKPNVVLEVRRTSTTKVVLQVTAEAGEVHLWNVQRLGNRFSNWGVAFANNYPGAVGGDNAYALGEPAGVGQSVITVASHRAEQMGLGGTLIYGTRSSFSSRGPTVDGRTKPDISGPGEAVRSSVNSFDPANSNPPFTVEVGGVLFPFATYSGTSMSSPAVTGVVALMLQANPWLSAEQVKEIIKETARLDNRTGAIGPEGSLEWGWGKVDAMAAVLAAATFVSTPDIQAEPDDVIAYPNPSDGLLWIEGMEPTQVRMYSTTGALVLERNIQQGGGPVSLSLEGLRSGLYLLELKGESRAVYKRIVVQ